MLPFVPADLVALEPQPRQAAMAASDEALRALLTANQCWTVRGSVDRVLMIGAVHDVCDRHGLLLALLAADIGAAAVALTRVTRRWFNGMPYDRLTAWVDSDHVEGVRWARMLGMQSEGLMRRWRSDGGDIFHYGWLRGERA